MGLEERRAVSSALEEGGRAVRRTGVCVCVLIWAFLLPQGSYWSSNHSE